MFPQATPAGVDLASYPGPLEARLDCEMGDCEKGTATRARQSYGSLPARLPPVFCKALKLSNPAWE